MFKTHAIFGLFLALLTFNYFNLNRYLFISITFISAIALDIDEENSYIGYRTKPLSNIINIIFKHRGFIHSFLFISILSFIIWLYFGNYFIPFLIGTISHLFLDSLTPMGIKAFYPFNFKIRGIFKTSGLIDHLLFFGIIILSLIH